MTPVAGEPKKPALSIDQEIEALRNAILDGMKINVNIVARAIVFHSLFQHLDLDLAIQQTNEVMDKIDPIGPNTNEPKK